MDESKYTRVHSEDSEELTDETRFSFALNDRKSNWKGRIFILLAFFIGASLGSLSTASWYRSRTPSINQMLKQLNTYTPLLDRHKITFEDNVVNGAIFNEPFSIYRSAPSEEVDAAWDAISEVRPFAISSADVIRLGKDPTQTVRVPEDWGYGKDAHFVELDSQHLLHCLNTLRKYMHHDYYFANYSSSTETLPRMQAVHRDHCLHLLLQTLTCQPSLNVLTFDWMETQQNPFPDFAIRRKCIDHRKILEWQKQDEIEGWQEKAKNLTRPAGAKVLPALEGLLDIGKELHSSHLR